MNALRLIHRPSIRLQAQRAIAGYKAERAGARPLSEAEITQLDDVTTFEQLNGEILIDHHDIGFLSWRDVFACRDNLNLAGAARQARESGYRFFAFGEHVYFVSCKGMVEDAGLTIGELR